MTRPKPYHETASGGQPRRYCTFEWLCQCGIPIYVGWGQSPFPWAVLFERRRHLPTPLGEYLQTLEKRPKLGWWRCGFQVPISRESAIALCNFRIEELAEIGIVPHYQPVKIKGRRVEIIRVWPDHSERYRSLTEAANSAGLSRRQAGRYVDSGAVDEHGAIWAAL